MKTTLTPYIFHLDKRDEAEAWIQLQNKLRTQGHRCFETYHHKETHHDLGKRMEGIVELDGSYIYDNQWNARNVGEEGYWARIFDWALDVYDNKLIKAGYHLDLTDEMKARRHDTWKCSYCGHQEHSGEAPPEPFHTGCYGSPYLEPTSLGLTRYRRVDDMRPYRGLTDAEKAAQTKLLLHSQMYARTPGDEATLQKSIAEAEEKYQTILASAEYEHMGLRWILDHGINPHHFIFYNHTKRWCVGWRGDGLHPAVAEAYKDALKEFPYPLDINISAGADSRREVIIP